MEYSRKFLAKRIFFSLLIANSFFSLNASAPVVEKAIVAPKVSEEKLLEELQDLVHSQIDRLGAALNSVGQSLQHKLFKKLSVEDRKKAAQDIIDLQKSLDEYQKKSSMHVDKYQLVILARLVNEFTRIITEALRSQLTTIPEIEPGNIIKRDGIVTTENIQNILQDNEKNLFGLTKLTEDAPLQWFHHISRAVTSTWKRYHLGPIAERALVYTGMSIWTIYLVPRSNLERLPLPESLIKTLLNLKDRVGGFAAEQSSAIYENTAPCRALKEPVDGKTHVLITSHGKSNDTNLRLVDSANPSLILNKDNVIGSDNLEDAVIWNLQGTTLGWSHQDPGVLARLISSVGPVYTIGGGAKVYGGWKTTEFFANYAYKDILHTLKKASEVAQDVRDFLEARKSVKKHYDATTEKTFDDVLGRENIKRRFKPLIDYLVHPDRYTRSGIKIPSGYLLAGPPQTGKTFMIDTLAGEIARALEKAGKTDKLRVYTVTVHDINEKGAAYWIRLARDKAPCLLFIDEFDTLRAQRDANSQLLAECLQCLHESILADERAPIFVAAATNRPENIDYALRVPGRLGEVIYFSFPLYADREIYFNHYFKKRAMDTSKIDINMLVRTTAGCSYGVMQVVANKVLTFAKIRNEAVTQKHVVQAINDAVKQVVQYDQEIPDNIARTIATRFASKALTSLLLQPKRQLCSVTIDQVIKEVGEAHVAQRYFVNDNGKDQPINFGGMFSYYTQDTFNMLSDNERVKLCKIEVAGNIGQKVLGQEIINHADDLQDGFKKAKELIFRGQEPNSYSRYEREIKYGQSYKLVEECETEVFKLLSEHKTLLEELVELLVKRHTLGFEEIEEAMKIETVADNSQEVLKRALTFNPKVNLLGDESHSQSIWM